MEARKVEYLASVPLAPRLNVNPIIKMVPHAVDMVIIWVIDGTVPSRRRFDEHRFLQVWVSGTRSQKNPAMTTEAPKIVWRRPFQFLK